MQVPNLKGDFEILHMKEKEIIQKYYDRLTIVVKKIRLLGEELRDSRVLEKVFVSLPEWFEAKISSLEDSRDISQVTLLELINVLQT